MPSALCSPSLLSPSIPASYPLSPPVDTTPSHNAVSIKAADDFDVSRTMALASAAMEALKAQLQKKSALVQQLCAEKREWVRQRKQLNLPAQKSPGDKSTAAVKRRKGSQGQVMEEAAGEEMDDFAAEVEQALQSKAERSGISDVEERRDDEEVASKEKTDRTAGRESREVIRVVRPEVVLATVVSAASGEVPAEAVKRKRGRPRIHPIKVKAEGAKRGRPRKAQPSEPLVTLAPPTPQAASIDSPTTLPFVPVVPEERADAPPASSPALKADVSPREVRPWQSPPLPPPPIQLQQLRVLVHAFASAASTEAIAPSPPASAQPTTAQEELVGRMRDLLCPCPCSSRPPADGRLSRHLEPPSYATPAPLPRFILTASGRRVHLVPVSVLIPTVVPLAFDVLLRRVAALGRRQRLPPLSPVFFNARQRVEPAVMHPPPLSPVG